MPTIDILVGIKHLCGDIMLLKSLSGKTLVETSHKTVRSTLEDAVARGIDLSFIDLRQARLSNASLDTIKARGASFWGADLQGADMGLADLRGCDMRCSDLKDTCLAESDLSGTNLQGAYFQGTILEGAMLDNVEVSCPSFWSCYLKDSRSFKNLVFHHKGEERIVIEAVPIVIDGLERRIIMLKDDLIVGEMLYRGAARHFKLDQLLFSFKTIVDQRFKATYLQNEKQPMPKRVNG